MKKPILLLLVIISIIGVSCKKEPTPDSLYGTEWVYKNLASQEFTISFPIDGHDSTTVTLEHPAKDMYTGEESNEIIYGSYDYNKPNLEMYFYSNCGQSGFVFINCDASGEINKEKIKFDVRGKTITFKKQD